MQWSVNRSMLRPPGATTGVLRVSSNVGSGEGVGCFIATSHSIPDDAAARTPRLPSSTGAFSCSFLFLNAYFIPTVGQELRQSKQPTHDAKSICRFLLSMHRDRHTRSQSPQSMQCSLSMVMRNSEKRETRLNTPPTGHNVLQKYFP